MPPVSFSVSEVRVAASCPRILYFDAEKTRRENLSAAGDDAHLEGERRRLDGLRHRSSITRSSGSTARRTRPPRSARSWTARPTSTAIEQGLRTFLNRQCIDLDALATKDVRAAAGVRPRHRGLHAGAGPDRGLRPLAREARRRDPRRDVRRPQAPGGGHLPGRAGGRAGPRHGDPRLRLLRLEDREPSDHRLQAHPRGPADQRPLPGEPLCPDAPPSASHPARRRRALPAPEAGDGRTVVGAGRRPSPSRLRPARVDGRLGRL